MQNHLYLFLLILLFPLIAFGQESVLPKRHSFIVDFGLGGIATKKYVRESPREPSGELTHFSNFPNLQLALGANVKMGPIQYEIKVGYAYTTYSYEGKSSNGGAGNFTSTTHAGEISNHRIFIQPLGINFGKDCKWGSVVVGAFLRKLISLKTTRNGSSISTGSYWDGNTMVPIDNTTPIQEMFYLDQFHVGAQLGAEFNLTDFSKLQIRTEVVPYGQQIGGMPAGFGYTLNVGYVFNLKAYKNGKN